MKKLKSINDFTYSTQFEVLGVGHAPCEIRFSPWSISERLNRLPELFIEINLGNKQSVLFGVIAKDEKIKRIAFNNVYFVNDEIKNLSSIFGFEFVQNPFRKERLQGSLSFVHPDYRAMKTIIKQHEERYYLLIYASRRSYPARSMSEDFYGDDIYYIHGIWEVELHEELKITIYK